MGGAYGGWNHWLNIVIMDGRQALRRRRRFGSNGPLQPNPLAEKWAVRPGYFGLRHFSVSFRPEVSEARKLPMRAKSRRFT